VRRTFGIQAWNLKDIGEIELAEGQNGVGDISFQAPTPRMNAKAARHKTAPHMQGSTPLRQVANAAEAFHYLTQGVEEAHSRQA